MLNFYQVIFSNNQLSSQLASFANSSSDDGSKCQISWSSSCWAVNNSWTKCGGMSLYTYLVVCHLITIFCWKILRCLSFSNVCCSSLLFFSHHLFLWEEASGAGALNEAGAVFFQSVALDLNPFNTKWGWTYKAHCITTLGAFFISIIQKRRTEDRGLDREKRKWKSQQLR